MLIIKRIGLILFLFAILWTNAALSSTINTEGTHQNIDAFNKINFSDYSFSLNLFDNENEENEIVLKLNLTNYEVYSNKYFETEYNFIFLQFFECSKIIAHYLIDLPPPTWQNSLPAFT